MVAAGNEMPEQPLKKPPGYREPNVPQPKNPSGGLKPPPGKPILPQLFYPEKKRRSRRRVVCCCLFITLLVLVFIILVSSAVFYLWFNPKLPVFRLGSFKVPQFNFSGDKAGDGWSLLTAQTIGRLDIKNPNGKLKYFYGDADVDVFVGQGDFETNVGSTKVLGFGQGPRNTTVVKVLTRVKNQKVDDPTSKRLKSELKSRALAVRIEAKTKVGFGVGRLRIGMLGISLRCGRVSLKSFDSEMAKCTINALIWINIRS